MDDTSPKHVKDDRRFSFTVAAINAIKPPAKGLAWYRDAKQPGLSLCVLPSGRRTFYFRHRGFPTPLQVAAFKLGVFPGCSIDLARAKAAAALTNINEGRDPKRDRRESLTPNKTVGDLWADYFEHYAKPNKKSWRSDERQWNAYLKPEFEKTDHATLTRDQVLMFRDKLREKSGLYTANRVMSLLRSIYSKTDENETRINPARRTKIKGESSRARFVQSDEFPRLFQALDALEKTGPSGVRHSQFFKLLLFTGARRANAQGMRWAHINLEAATWTIPGTEFKNGKPHTIALVPEAVAILKKRREILPKDCAWVFPARGKSGHMEEPKTVWKQVLKSAGIEGLRLHDLRRTHGSVMAAGNTGLPIIGKALGHRSQSTTAIYTPLDLKPVREAVSAAVRLMLDFANPKPQAPKRKNKKSKKGESDRDSTRRE